MYFKLLNVEVLSGVFPNMKLKVTFNVNNENFIIYVEYKDGYIYTKENLKLESSVFKALKTSILNWNFEQNIYNKASIIQYINTNHNFWNLGTAEKVYWDGIWNFNNMIDFSGIKPDALYRERQTHLLSIKNLLMPVLYININYKIENKEQINSKCKQVISYSNKTENKINNKQKIYKKYQVSNINKNNVIQNRTANTKNCWDGSFCLDGSHILSGAYEIDKQMENICVFYSTKHGIIDEGSKEIL